MRIVILKYYTYPCSVHFTVPITYGLYTEHHARPLILREDNFHEARIE